MGLLSERWLMLRVAPAGLLLAGNVVGDGFTGTASESHGGHRLTGD